MKIHTVIGCTAIGFFLGCSSSDSSGVGGGKTSTASEVTSTASGDMTPPTIQFFDLEDGTQTSTTKVLWTDSIDVHLDHLPPSTEVTVIARYTGWGSSTLFKTDDTGSIDVATASAESGSYQGVDREGIVWSMTASKSDSDTGADPYALRVSAQIDGNEVANATLTRLAEATDVQCSKVTDQGLVGVYCAKTNGPPQGAIVAFGGSEGGGLTGQELAEYYASLGYPSLGLAYFGATGVPAQLSEIPLEYFQTAFTWIAQKPGVSPGKLAVVGGSRGGELALLLGATFPSVTAVVAVLPSGVTWGAPTANGLSEVASWTYQGQPIAYVPFTFGTEKKVTEPDGVIAYEDREIFEQSIALATPDEVDQATSRVENTHGPVLLLAASDDHIWPSCDLGQLSMNRLMSSGHSAQYPDALVCYPNAGHNITPFSLNVPTTTGMHSSFKENGEYLDLGGNPGGIAHAARDADDKTRAFLAAALQ